jgi:hypothetical protein
MRSKLVLLLALALCTALVSGYRYYRDYNDEDYDYVPRYHRESKRRGYLSDYARTMALTDDNQGTKPGIFEQAKQAKQVVSQFFQKQGEKAYDTINSFRPQYEDAYAEQRSNAKANPITIYKPEVGAFEKRMGQLPTFSYSNNQLINQLASKYLYDPSDVNKNINNLLFFILFAL